VILDSPKTPAIAAPRLDLPAPGEAVTSATYSLRVNAPEAALVAISIDGAPWVACRFMAGYWWHEWAGYGAGRHVVSLRSRAPDGAVRARSSRLVAVRLRGIGDEPAETD